LGAFVVRIETRGLNKITADRTGLGYASTKHFEFVKHPYVYL